MLRKAFEKKSEDVDNVFWVTMTDLLLGLAIIFMVLFVLAITGFSQQKINQQNAQSSVAKELIKNMQKQNINAQIDKYTGEVKLSDLELFDLNSWELSPKGKDFLSKFIPIYINTIYSNPKLADNISNIIIQGHTDSHTFAGVNSKEEQYTRNMDLSLKRANAVEQYIFQTNYNKNYTDKLTKSLIVEGRSYSEPIFTNGKEDYIKSRRVELKLVVKDKNIQDYILDAVK